MTTGAKMLDAIRKQLTRLALREYVKLGAFIVRNGDALSRLEIARFHEAGRATIDGARRVHRELRGVAND